MLSQAGREVLIKSVAQAIPVYCMSVFLLPTSLEEEIQCMINSFWWGSIKEDRRGINWLSWEKLTMRKKWGGMGFRDLHGFNLAMLGKQGWKFMTDPDAMVTKVLKAKYFPRGDFLGAVIGHNPSYVWRSIWSSRILLEEGHRWRVGDGSLIPMWKTPWLRCDDNPRLQTQPQHHNKFLTVHHLIDSTTGVWNAPLLNQLLLPRDVEEVLNIPLLHLTTPDELIWRFDKRGLYTVNSAYRACMETLISRDEMKIAGHWDKLWALHIPPKIKTFMWRLGRNCLPTRERLQEKGLHLVTACISCNHYTESNWHLFLECPISIDCWRGTPLWPILEPIKLQAESFIAFFFQVLELLNSDQLAIFAMNLWSIWKRRNVLLWDGTDEPAAAVISRGHELLHAWTLARRPAHSTQRPPASAHDLRWKPPAPNYLKCNLDAAIFNQQRKVGIGMCVRDDHGQFVMARTDWCMAKMSAAEGEAWGLLEAIHWIIAAGITKVIFKMDSKQVVEDVLNAKSNKSEYGSIIDKCRMLLSSNNEFEVIFTRRQANGSAHALAKASILNATRSDFHYIPGCIVSIITNEMH